MAEGRIIKALSGFYYVKTEEGDTFQCRGRGVFRNQNITPLVGDFVVFEYENPDEGYIMEVKQRDNELARPPIANVTQAFIVSSAKEPEFNPLLMDRFLVLIESKGIKAVIFITKIDLLSSDEKTDFEAEVALYRQIGYQVEIMTTKDETTYETLIPYFKNHVSVIAGQSGVGKSTILNMLDKSLDIETGEISKSLGRGRHTTRHVELIPMHDGLVADTPGFSSLTFSELETNELSTCFPEFRQRMSACKFRGCMHVREPKCAIKDALAAGEIAESRYESYLKFLEEIQTRKPRY